MENGLGSLIQLLIVLIFSPLLPGVIGKTKAFFAGRRGPPLFQPYYDILKLLKKGNVYSTTTTWIFQAAPIVSLAAVVTSSLFVPLGTFSPAVSFWGDVILFIYLYALARFFVIIAALDTGSSFEGMGASREAAFSCLAEITVIMNFILLAMVSESVILSRMLGINIFSSWNMVGPVLIFVVISYFLVLLAENARIPVDDPATHLELTMIHEVMVLDHSGWDLAYIFYGSAVKLFVLSSILLNLLIPRESLTPVTGMLAFLLGMLGLAVVVGIVESTMARLRLNRVPHLLIGAFVLALTGFVVILFRGL